MNDLRRRLVDRIRASGPLTFTDFMESALYDPADGFFSRAPVGREFVTSSHVSPVFGLLMARQVNEIAEILGAQPTVVDLGAGDGMLGTQLRSAIDGLHVVAVERSDLARAHLAEVGFETHASLEDAEPVTGVVITNELFDNIPFHLMRDDKEVMIAEVDGALVEFLAEPTIEGFVFRSGEYPVLGPQARAIVDQLANVVARGYVLVVDYGFVSGEQVEPIRGYAGNRAVEDLLGWPGETDITGPVDFDALAECARAAGFQTFGPITQREALMALGYRDALDELRDAQKADEERQDWRSALSAFSARGEAAMLVDPSGLGSLKVLVMATEGLPRPRIVPVP